jgi:hypothetical protein
MRFISGLILTGLAMLVIATSAIAQELPDASCPGPADMAETNTGTARFAQTFTAQNTGALTSAQVGVDKTGTAGDWIVQILGVDGTGTPTNTVLASTSVSDATVASGFTTIPTSFPMPATVSAGQQYAVEFSRPTSDTTGVLERGSNACPGAIFAADVAPNPFSSAGETNNDMVFSVFVTPPPPSTDTTPPQTTLGKHLGHKTSETTAKFTFSSDEPGTSFECKLDKKAFQLCASPKKYRHLNLGKHLFQVKSIDVSGNVDASPATFKWKVLP